MTVRAKMRCVKFEQSTHGQDKVQQIGVVFQPVYESDESKPNGQWSKWTPSGQLELQITNPECFKAFEVGKSYYVDISPRSRRRSSRSDRRPAALSTAGRSIWGMRFGPLALLALGLSLAALALPLDRGIVEDGASGLKSAGATGDGGIVLVYGQSSARLAPATCASGTCTRAAPTASDEGMSMDDISSARLQVCAPGPRITEDGGTAIAHGVQFLVDAGTMHLDCTDPRTGQWATVVDRQKAITEVGKACQTWAPETFSFMAAGVRCLYRASGIGTTGNDGGSAVISFQGCRRPSVKGVYQGGCGP